MIRVLHIVGKMDRGGIETFLMNVYRNINREKIQFDFLTCATETPGDYDNEILDLGGRIYQVPGRRQGWLGHLRKLHEFFKEHPEYSIVHAHVSSLTNVSVLRIARKYGIHCRIVHSHNTREGGSAIHKCLHRINQLTLATYATDFFACSDLAAKWMYPKKQYKEGRYCVINNGIDTKNFAFNEDSRKEKRRQLGIEGKYVIGHIGRFHRQKNHHFLIDIFAELKARDEDCVLLLIGDGELRTSIEKKVRDLGLTESVRFLGVRSDIPDLLQAMDLFLLPSFHEGLPVVLVEAQTAGLRCCVSSAVSKEANITNLVEFVNLENSVEVWANAVLKNKNYLRKDTADVVTAKGYDITQIAEDLQKWYEFKAKTDLQI